MGLRKPVTCFVRLGGWLPSVPGDRTPCLGPSLDSQDGHFDSLFPRITESVLQSRSAHDLLSQRAAQRVMPLSDPLSECVLGAGFRVRRRPVSLSSCYIPNYTLRLACAKCREFLAAEGSWPTANWDRPNVWHNICGVVGQCRCEMSENTWRELSLSTFSAV